jgi:hypothetical protein
LTPAGRGARGIATIPFAAFLVLAMFLWQAPARAGVNLQIADPTAPTTYVPPGANLGPPPPAREPVTHKWWFWTAVAGLVVATVVVVLVAEQAPSPPKSTLGNMDAFRGQ